MQPVLQFLIPGFMEPYNYYFFLHTSPQRGLPSVTFAHLA